MTHLHRLSPSKLRQREYERPDCWERQIEGLYERALASGTNLLAPYMTTDAARFTHNQSSNVLSLEAALFNLVGAALKAKGHELRSVNGGAVGGYQGILFTRDPRLPEPTFDARSTRDDLPVNGVYRAGSDHRKDGQAVGW